MKGKLLTEKDCLNEIERITKLEISNTEKVFRIGLVFGFHKHKLPYEYGQSLSLANH